MLKFGLTKDLNKKKQNIKSQSKKTLHSAMNLIPVWLEIYVIKLCERFSLNIL